jgi:hypothetical protein
MTNYANYAAHVLNEPSYYQRRFEFDLPDWDEVQRVALVALPFVSLCKPIGQGISVVMGGCRCVTHLWQASEADDVGCCAWEVVQTALAVLALAGTIFCFQVGLFITTGADVVMALARVIQNLQEEKYAQAMEELLQALSSLIYLGMLASGSLEIALVSILLQAVISLIQARGDWEEGRWLECGAKVVMGGVRLYQAHGQMEMIQRKNALLTMQKYAKLMEQVNKGKEAWHLVDSGMHQRDREVILVDAHGKPVNFGAHFHGCGKETIKGMNLEFKTIVVDGKKMTELDFKVNHVFRDRLEKMIEGFKDFTPQEMREFLALTSSHAKGFKMEMVPFVLAQGEYVGSAYKMTLEGLGSVYVGNSKDYPNIFDRVKVEVSEGANLYQIHELLSFFNLDDALRISSADDIERLKIGHLFRVFYPKQATLLERDEKFFKMSVKDLKAEIVRLVPDMQKVFDDYLAKMEATEILPGKMRYKIPGLADEARLHGARALIAAITGTAGSTSEAYARVASILKMGMISSEMRFDHGMKQKGLSPSADFETGGADSVFTQLLTVKNADQKMGFYTGEVRLLFSLNLIETGTYQYSYDAYGERNYYEDPEKYLKRPGIMDFILKEEQFFHPGQEVMIKERIPPSMIQGIVVKNETARQELIACLKAKELIVMENGIETILRIPIKQFIHLEGSLSEWVKSH